MRSRMITTMVLGAALVASAGCGSRRPPSLPPAPGGTSGSGSDIDGGAGGTSGSGVAIPGSRDDFLQSVPGDRVYFALDSYALTSEARATLDAQAQWLNANGQVTVTLEGHADERGTREYNIALGERRANATRLYLEGRGVQSSRMNVISYGKERPEAFGNDETSHQRNRRAVTLVPN